MRIRLVAVLVVITIFYFSVNGNTQLRGSQLEAVAGKLANDSLTQILGRRPFLAVETNADYTEYIAEDLFWRLVSTAPNYHYFVFSMLFHKDWVGWYVVRFFRSDPDDILGHNVFQDKHYKATAVVFGFVKSYSFFPHRKSSHKK